MCSYLIAVVSNIFHTATATHTHTHTHTHKHRRQQAHTHTHTDTHRVQSSSTCILKKRSRTRKFLIWLIITSLLGIHTPLKSAVQPCSLTRGTPWPNRWPSETFEETRTSSVTVCSAVLEALEQHELCLVRFNTQSLRALASKDPSL